MQHLQDVILARHRHDSLRVGVSVSDSRGWWVPAPPRLHGAGAYGALGGVLVQKMGSTQ